MWWQYLSFTIWTSIIIDQFKSWSKSRCKYNDLIFYLSSFLSNMYIISETSNGIYEAKLFGLDCAVMHLIALDLQSNSIATKKKKKKNRHIVRFIKDIIIVNEREWLNEPWPWLLIKHKILLEYGQELYWLQTSNLMNSTVSIITFPLLLYQNDFKRLVLPNN